MYMHFIYIYIYTLICIQRERLYLCLIGLLICCLFLLRVASASLAGFHAASDDASPNP